MKIQARAKINLFLEVLSKRPDGYHELDTVFQSISLSDDLFIDKQTGGMTLTVSEPSVPAGEENLVWRVYDLVKRRFPGKTGGVKVHLEKRIPPGAGLGGGSADAAAMLAVLNRLFDLGLDEIGLQRLSLEIGMDVPFCLKGGTVRASGRGERLTPLRRELDFRILVVYPGFSISTQEAYESMDAAEPWDLRTSDVIVAALGKKKVEDLWPLLYNSFESVLLKKYPLLQDLKAALREGGCSTAIMTGSGSALCGFVPLKRDVSNLVALLKKEYPFVALTRPVDTGVVFFDNAE